MIPILYDHFETAFESEGVGRLTDCISCTVKETINGEYEMEMQYPISGKWFDYLVNFGGVICATHDHNGDIQPFDIYRYSAPIDGIVTFYAHHISYRLSNVIVGDKEDVMFIWGGGTPEEVFARIEPLAFTPCIFTFEDLTGYMQEPLRAFRAAGRLSVRDGFLNGYRTDDPLTGTKALVEVFPGEFEWDKFHVKYYRRRGSVRGVQIRYGKNITEVTRERDTSNLISSVFPFWIGNVEGPDGGEARSLVYGDQAFSLYCEIQYAPWDYAANGFQMETPAGDPYYFGAADTRAAAVDFSSQFSEKPTSAQLTEAAREWMSKNSTWKAYDNITVKFVDLYNAAEYQDVKELEKCSLGDYVNVYYKALGIVAENIEIVSTTYDVLLDSFLEMELGEIKTSFVSTILKTIEGGQKA